MSRCGQGCKYWSEMVAQGLAGRPIEAMCLAPEGPFRGEFTSARGMCVSYSQGTPVDSPQLQREGGSQ